MLDVSWHTTANPASGPLNKFLMEPNIKDTVMVSACVGGGGPSPRKGGWWLLRVLSNKVVKMPVPCAKATGR